MTNTHSEKSANILVIDDDNDLRYSLKRVLSGRQFEVFEASSGEDGLKMAEQIHPQVILLDNRMEGMGGIEVLQHLRSANPNAMVILMTAYGTTQTTIEAMKFGAFDYIMKPFDHKKILDLVESALRASADLERANYGEKSKALSKEDIESGVIGRSAVMQAVFKMIGQVAASDVTVMITGESGTGKELIARSIYKHSLRSALPFSAVNCAAIPDNLIESELFGHEKGAFTGATNQRIGKFELCDKGTIFLDEIGDMAPATQTKILRVLQEGEIQRVGGSETLKVDVRILAATNKPLEAMVKDNTFREDLYYRLNVVRIHIPPLRERMEDVPELIDFALKRLTAERKVRVKGVSAEALAVLCDYPWPGNVRELQNLIYRSAVIAQGDTILVKDLPSDLVARSGGVRSAVADSGSPAAEAAPIPVTPAGVDSPAMTTPNNAFDMVYRKLREEAGTRILECVERELIVRALEEAEGNQTKAAEILGITRVTLRKRIDQYNLASAD